MSTNNAINNNIAGATGLTVAGGGTGRSTLTLNNVLLGNGTTAVQLVAPGTSGNVLTSNGTTWASTTPASSSGWGLTGNAGTSPGTNFIGTTDAQDIYFKRNSVLSGRVSATNTFLGYSSGNTTMSGLYNTYYGAESGRSITSGSYATAVGMYALEDLASGLSNTAVGYDSLSSCTSGSTNTGLGTSSLAAVVSGGSNTAIGYGAGATTTGSGSVFLGARAGQYETGSNSFYVDNQERGTTAAEKVSALLYGTFNATVANQTLVVNGKFGCNSTTPVGKQTTPSGTDSQKITAIIAILQAFGFSS